MAPSFLFTVAHPSYSPSLLYNHQGFFSHNQRLPPPCLLPLCSISYTTSSTEHGSKITQHPSVTIPFSTTQPTRRCMPACGTQCYCCEHLSGMVQPLDDLLCTSPSSLLTGTFHRESRSVLLHVADERPESEESILGVESRSFSISGPGFHLKQPQSEVPALGGRGNEPCVE